MTSTWQALCERAAGHVGRGPEKKRAETAEEAQAIDRLTRSNYGALGTSSQISGLALFARLMSVCFDEPRWTDADINRPVHHKEHGIGTLVHVGPNTVTVAFHGDVRWVLDPRSIGPLRWDTVTIGGRTVPQSWDTPAPFGRDEHPFPTAWTVREEWQEATGCATPGEAKERIGIALSDAEYYKKTRASSEFCRDRCEKALERSNIALEVASTEIVRLRAEVERLSKPRSYRCVADKPWPRCSIDCDGDMCSCDCHGAPKKD
jgi:hypothetical protein